MLGVPDRQRVGRYRSDPGRKGRVRQSQQLGIYIVALKPCIHPRPLTVWWFLPGRLADGRALDGESLGAPCIETKTTTESGNTDLGPPKQGLEGPAPPGDCTGPGSIHITTSRWQPWPLNQRS